MSVGSPTTPLVNVEANRHKDLGNEAFKQGHFQAAISHYTDALATEKTAALFCNRAFANLRLQFSGDALNDADEALKLDVGFVKAYYRKATAYLQLGKFKEALREFKLAGVIAPTDADIQQRIKDTEKEYRRIQFLTAIASKDAPPPSKVINPAAITVPASYDGPRIGEDGIITLQFVLDAMEYFRQEKIVHKKYLVMVLLEALKALKAHPNVVPIPVDATSDVTVCGDTHGQYYDLLNIFKLNGNPSPSNRYLFNGDFVDRGSYSVENVSVLLAFKALFPNDFFMSRGNHEGQGLNRVYGFEGEVKQKYDEPVYDLFQEVFNALPLAHIVNEKIFVAHGGLFSKDNVTIAEIQQVNRFRDIPDEGLMCELMWADPRPMPGRGPSKRGVGHSFGPDVTDNFLATNRLQLFIRSHEVQENGYAMMHQDRLITVFSAPNYCDQVGNKGAFIRFSGSGTTPAFSTFSEVPHPGKRAMQYSSMRMMGGI